MPKSDTESGNTQWPPSIWSRADLDWLSSTSRLHKRLFQKLFRLWGKNYLGLKVGTVLFRCTHTRFHENNYFLFWFLILEYGCKYWGWFFGCVDEKKKQMEKATEFLQQEMGQNVNRASRDRLPINLSKDEIQLYIKRFQIIDKDRKGYVSINDIRRSLKVSPFLLFYLINISLIEAWIMCNFFFLTELWTI